MIILFTLSIVWLGYVWLGLSVGAFYHPNAHAGNYGLHFWWVFALLVLVNLIVSTFLVKKRDNKKRIAVGSLAVFILLTTSQFFLSSVERNHNITYFIGEQEYSIPWTYNPINGSEEIGGDYFVVKVSYPAFRPQYEDESYFDSGVTLSKAVSGSRNFAGRELVSECEIGIDNFCQPFGTGYFVDGDFTYTFHRQGSQGGSFTSVDEIETFKQNAVDLFASFEKKS